MKKSFSKLFTLLIIPFLIGGCSSSTGSKGTEQYFKFVQESLDDEPTPDEIYKTFYDQEENRFYIDLYFDDHLGLSLRIVEYDLWNMYIYPCEGEIASDYESISFINESTEKSDYFSRGTYVLKHEIKSGKDTFSLDAAGTTYALTLFKKASPNYIVKDLVGEFEYQSGGNTFFSIKVEVGEKKDGYPVSISLKEESKTFTASNIKNTEESTTFDISGNEDGDYVKREKGVSLSYQEGYDHYEIKFKSTTYPLVKTKGMDDDKPEETNYFLLNAGKIELSCSAFKVKLANSNMGGQIYLIINELVASGRTINCWFRTTEDGSIVNNQNITNPNNQIFVGHDEYKFTHRVESDTDIVDLYFDDVLAYSNLTITNVEE